MLILVPGVAPSPRCMALDSSVYGFHIENSRDEDDIDLQEGEVQRHEAFKSQYHRDLTIRTPSMPSYNCHGMVFASRRTAVRDPSIVQRILLEESYLEISDAKMLMPGDIVAYYNEDVLGESIVHTGVVLSALSYQGDTMVVPKILSKWGNFEEIIHNVDVVCYEYSRLGYFRYTRREPKTWTQTSLIIT